jgi:hypothetical protein
MTTTDPVLPITNWTDYLSTAIQSLDQTTGIPSGRWDGHQCGLCRTLFVMDPNVRTGHVQLTIVHGVAYQKNAKFRRLEGSPTFSDLHTNLRMYTWRRTRARVGNAKFCVLLLCTPEAWEDYDQGSQ